MCRHEAAEALGALGDWESLGLLRGLRDEAGEAEVVRETCEIAVGRIEWDHSAKKKSERLRTRWVLYLTWPVLPNVDDSGIAISHL